MHSTNNDFFFWNTFSFAFNSTPSAFAGVQDYEERLHQFQALTDNLPPVNYETLKRVIGHLRKLVSDQGVNFSSGGV